MTGVQTCALPIFEMGEIEGAMSSLSIAVAGILTVVGASVFANFL